MKNKKCYGEIPDGWWKGRSHTPSFKELEKCSVCEQKDVDMYWWKEYIDSGMSVSKFVRELYPYNRATFYVMKSRLAL